MPNFIEYGEYDDDCEDVLWDDDECEEEEEVIVIYG